MPVVTTVALVNEAKKFDVNCEARALISIDETVISGPTKIIENFFTTKNTNSIDPTSHNTSDICWMLLLLLLLISELICYNRCRLSNLENKRRISLFFEWETYFILNYLHDLIDGYYVHIVECRFVLESNTWECDLLLILVDHSMGMLDNENQARLSLKSKEMYCHWGMSDHGLLVSMMNNLNCYWRETRWETKADLISNEWNEWMNKYVINTIEKWLIHTLFRLNKKFRIFVIGRFRIWMFFIQNLLEIKY